MYNELGRIRGPVLDGIHPWNRSQIVTGRGRPGHATPLGPLYVPGMSEGGAGEGAHGIPTQSAQLPPPAPLSQPCVGARQALFRAQDPDPQAPLHEQVK